MTYQDDWTPRDPLSAARGTMLAVFASGALWLFAAGALFAATDSETLGAWCMVGGCVSSLIAIIVGRNNAARS